MALFNSNLVVSARQVNSTEHSRFTKLIKQVMDTRDWKHVKACLFIQASKINTHSKLSCLFPHKQDRGTIWQDAGANPAFCQHVIYMLLNHFKFIGRQTVLLVARGGGIFIYQINGMVKCSVRSQARSLKHILKLITQSSILCTNLVFPTLRLFLAITRPY